MKYHPIEEQASDDSSEDGAPSACSAEGEAADRWRAATRRALVFCNEVTFLAMMLEMPKRSSMKLDIVPEDYFRVGAPLWGWIAVTIYHYKRYRTCQHSRFVYSYIQLFLLGGKAEIATVLYSCLAIELHTLSWGKHMEAWYRLFWIWAGLMKCNRHFFENNKGDEPRSWCPTTTIALEMSNGVFYSKIMKFTKYVHVVFAVALPAVWLLFGGGDPHPVPTAFWNVTLFLFACSLQAQPAGSHGKLRRSRMDDVLCQFHIGVSVLIHPAVNVLMVMYGARSPRGLYCMFCA